MTLHDVINTNIFFLREHNCLFISIERCVVTSQSVKINNLKSPRLSGLYRILQRRILSKLHAHGTMSPTYRPIRIMHNYLSLGGVTAIELVHTVYTCIAVCYAILPREKN